MEEENTQQLPFCAKHCGNYIVDVAFDPRPPGCYTVIPIL